MENHDIFKLMVDSKTSSTELLYQFLCDVCENNIMDILYNNITFHRTVNVKLIFLKRISMGLYKDYFTDEPITDTMHIKRLSKHILYSDNTGFKHTYYFMFTKDFFPK